MKEMQRGLAEKYQLAGEGSILDKGNETHSTTDHQASIGMMKDGSNEALEEVLSKMDKLTANFQVEIQYKDLGYTTFVPNRISVPTVGNTLKNMLVGSGPRHKVDILKEVNGRIRPGRFTLILGPPGSGKSVFMKALSGRLLTGRTMGTMTGEITFNGQAPENSTFRVQKVVDYIEQGDNHCATLTVEETLQFAWTAATGGHHSYGLAKDEESAHLLNEGDASFEWVNNVVTMLGLTDCRKTIVGNQLLRGVSGGEKRRVTTGEMLVCPRPVKIMDGISIGLDSATTYDVLKATRSMMKHFQGTYIVSLLQPPPEVFDLFDDVIILSEGQIIFQGPREDVLSYFESIGFICPAFMDVADFLQELPTPEGTRFISDDGETHVTAPRGTEALVTAWKLSDLYNDMIRDMEATMGSNSVSKTNNAFMSIGGNAPTQTCSKDERDVELGEAEGEGSSSSVNHAPADNDNVAAAGTAPVVLTPPQTSPSTNKKVLQSQSQSQVQVPTATAAAKWPKCFREPYAASQWFLFKLALERQFKVIFRDVTFIRTRVVQCLVAGALSGSLFCNIRTTNTTSMNGFLFFTILFNAFGSFALIPIIFAQKAVFYKQADSRLIPAFAFVLSQAAVQVPLHLIEVAVFGTITYCSAGLSADYQGSRYFTFQLILFLSALSFGQWFRFVAYVMPSRDLAFPAAGVSMVSMVLFSGFIIAKSAIPPGWIWFYWINPAAWSIRSVTMNEYKSPRYDYTCVNPPMCTIKHRYGDVVLQSRGNPTDENWIWFGVAVLIGLFVVFVVLSTLVVQYWRVEPKPLPPMRFADADYTNLDDDPLKDKHESAKTSRKLSMKEAGNGNGSGSRKGTKEAAAEKHASSEHSAKRELEALIHDMAFEPVTMAFRDIWYTVHVEGKGKKNKKGKTEEKNEEKRGEEEKEGNKEEEKGEEKKEGDLDILRGVSGYFEPGTMTALMGNTGAGKTTLMDVLAGWKNQGKVRGEMFINGRAKNDHSFKHLMGYVEQFDSLAPRDTVREAVEFSAALRLPNTTTMEQRMKWVNYVLKTLELIPLANTMIGLPLKGGISFEQRKRTSMAVELAANPSLFFLDEPTTGLDSRAALVVVRCIRRIAATGRTVVCTIHQPSTSIFSAFDSLLLLKRGGQAAYMGPLGFEFDLLIEYFMKAPGVTRIESRQNPATWMLEVIGAGTNSTEIAGNVDFAEFYKQSSLCQENTAHIEVLSTPDFLKQEEGESGGLCMTITSARRLSITSADVLVQRYHISPVTQFKWLGRRVVVAYWRSPGYNLTRIIINSVIALIFSSVYANQQYDSDVGVLARSGVIFITCMFCGVIGLVTCLPVMINDRPAFYREQHSGMYNVAIYSIVTDLIEIPYVAVTALFFTVPFFYIVGFDQTGDATSKFFWYWLFHGLYSGIAISFGQFFGAVVPSEEVATVLVGLTSMMLSLFCGFMIKTQDFPRFWLFMNYLNPLHYALEGLTMSQFKGDATQITLMTGQKTTAEAFIDSYYSTWSYNNIRLDALYLILYIIVLKIWRFLALKRLRWEIR